MLAKITSKIKKLELSEDSVAEAIKWVKLKKSEPS
jgi:hypothetical protein